jgi:glycerol kinase
LDSLRKFGLLAITTVPNGQQNLTGGVQGGLHVTDPTNASRTLLMDLRKLEWSPPLLNFFGFRSSILPKLVSSSQVYGSIASGSLKGVKIAGIVGDQQGALVGNKCFKEGEAKCTYSTGLSNESSV